MGKLTFACSPLQYVIVPLISPQFELDFCSTQLRDNSSSRVFAGRPIGWRRWRIYTQPDWPSTCRDRRVVFSPGRIDLTAETSRPGSIYLRAQSISEGPSPTQSIVTPPRSRCHRAPAATRRYWGGIQDAPRRWKVVYCTCLNSSSTATL